MQLTQYTDYSLRVLIYLAMKTDGMTTITELADFYAISRNHLVKVVHHLAQQQLILTQRGKNGGMRLARPPEQINIGDVVRLTEPNFHIAECFNRDNNQCVLTSDCQLKSILHEANAAFLATLDRYTIADTIANPTIPIIWQTKQHAVLTADN
ncbi:MAG: Rrf2 family transcriptional regulator [Sulfuriferula sp.]